MRVFAAAGWDVVCVFPGGDSVRQPPAGEVAVGRSVTAGGQPLGSRPLPGWIRRVKRAVLPMPTMLGARSRLLTDVLDSERPDLLHVSSVAQAAYADGLPHAALWFDMSDLLSEFATREAASRRWPARQVANLQRDLIARTEQAYVARATVITAAGWTDAALVTARSATPAHWLPTPVSVDDFSLGAKPNKVAGFLANFDFAPNVDAWQLLVSRWLPGLRAAGWRVVLAGLGSGALPPTDGVELLGPVRDVGEFYQRVTVTLAPIRLGGGMKVKVAESLLAGRPVIATPFAIEGFPPEIRALTTVVDVDAPDWSMLIDGPAPLPPSARQVLSVFGAEAFRQRADELLRTLR